MSRTLTTPEIGVLVERQQDQRLGSVEIGVLKQGN